MIFTLAKTLKTSITRQLTHLLVAGSLMGVTPHHELQLANGRWIQAQNLHAGDHLRTPTGIAQVQDVCTETIEPTKVYSLELENDAPYFVGQAQVLAAGTCDLRTIYSTLGDINVWTNFRGILKGLSETDKADLLKLLATFSSKTDLQKLITTLTNEKNMKAWLALKKNGRVGSGITDLKALYRNPDAIEALAKATDNANCTRLGLTEDILAQMKGWQFENSGKTFTEVIDNILFIIVP